MPPRKDYTPDQMGRAIEAVQKGAKVSVAALQFGVPRVTLHNKVTGKTPLVCTMGPKTVLTTSEENILVNWLLALSDRHFPITKDILLNSVQKIITDGNRETPFNNNRPGKKWLQSFFKRHPELVIRTPENLSTARDQVTENSIRNWFREIEQYLEENNLKDIIQEPSRIFNADESAFFLSPKPGQVITKKGEKHLYTSCGDDKENLTALFTANAAGIFAPPMIVFSYERIPANIAASVPDNWAIGKSESGWMCGSTFYEYVTNIFNPWLEEMGIKKPVLFFVDGHKSHLTLHLSKFCSENGIELIALFPNSTHILQPLDLAVFRPLKVFWKNAVNDWKMENLGQNLRKENFAPILNKAITHITNDCVKNGFRAAGLFPFGPEYIDMTKIKGSNEKNTVRSNPALSEFVKYLENEIVQVFSKDKLNLFYKLFYEDRSIVESRVPDEDISLYVLWAKCKAENLTCNSIVENLGTLSQQTKEKEHVQMGSTAVSSLDRIETQQEDKTPDLKDREQDCLSPLNVLSGDVLQEMNQNLLQTSGEQNLTDFTQHNLKNAEQNSLEHHIASLEPEDPLSKPEILKDNINITCSNMSHTSRITALDVNEPGPSNYKTPQKTTIDNVLGMTVPTPFKRNLFWPEETDNKKKKRIKREKIPSAVTGKAWKEYHEKKELLKTKQQTEKEERARMRFEKKMLKENIAKRKINKTKLKEKQIVQNESTSEDSDSEVKYAESDDSYGDFHEKDFSMEYEVRKKTLQKPTYLPEGSDNTDIDDLPISELTSLKTGNVVKPAINPGDYVIVKYEGEHFPGKVENVEGNQYEVSTMTFSTGNSFKWPDAVDKIWYNRENVVQQIDEPVCVKRGFFKVKEMKKYLPFIYEL